MKLLIVLGVLGLLSAQEIGLEDYLTKVKTHHPFFKKETLGIKSQELSRDRYLGEEDWVLKSNPFMVHQEPTSSSPFSPTSLDQYKFSASVQRPFWATGGNVMVSASTDYSNQEMVSMQGFPSSAPEFYQNQVSVTYMHPFLQGNGGVLNRLNYELSDFAVELTAVRSKENEENFILNLSQMFLEWVYTHERFKIMQERLKLAEEELERTQKKRKAFLVDHVDVLRSEDAVRTWKQNVLLASSQFNALRNQLAIIAQDKSVLGETPVFNLYQFNTVNIFTNDIEKSRVVKQLTLTQKQLEHQRFGLKEFQKPRLDLQVMAGLKGGDTGFSDALKMNKPDFQVALNFSMPLGFRTANLDVERAEIDQQKLEAETHQVSLDLQSNAQNLFIQMKDLRQVLVLMNEQIETSKAKTSEELKTYQQGRGDLTFVIQSQDSEQNIKLNYAQNALTFQKLLLQYRALLDQLVTD